MGLYSTTNRLLHWSIFFAFLVLAYTETMNNFFYSKEAILKSFEMSMAALGYQDIPPLDRLFIARLERRESWMWHYYAGVIFVVLSTIRFVLFAFNKKRRYHALHISLFLIIVSQFITGYSLWAYPHIYDWQIITRAIHHYSVWALYGIIFIHIFVIIKNEINGTNSGAISKMIGGVQKFKKQSLKDD